MKKHTQSNETKRNWIKASCVCVCVSAFFLVFLIVCRQYVFDGTCVRSLCAMLIRGINVVVCTHFHKIAKIQCCVEWHDESRR